MNAKLLKRFFNAAGEFVGEQQSGLYGASMSVYDGIIAIYVIRGFLGDMADGSGHGGPFDAWIENANL